jgi:hypothetical protein
MSKKKMTGDWLNGISRVESGPYLENPEFYINSQ